METYETELGYSVLETLEGLEASEDGKVVCTLYGKSLSDYENEDGSIDEDKLDSDIYESVWVEDFLNWQRNYCRL